MKSSWRPYYVTLYVATQQRICELTFATVATFAEPDPAQLRQHGGSLAVQAA